MDRRESLQMLFKKGKAPKKSTLNMPPPGGDLTPYSGPWTIRESAHLLRRTTFGPNQEMIAEALEKGLSNTVNELFEKVAPTEPPLRYTLDEPDPNTAIYAVLHDPNVPFGETWVNEPPVINTGDPVFDQQLVNTRRNSAYAWITLNQYREELNLMPKLWMFWHNHFVVSDFVLPLELYQYSNLIEQYAKGDFKALTKAMTINVSMLRYLNGHENHKDAPNENYARELLELFTVGKGELAGPGDYTTFTEEDVQAMARVLTGWRIDLSVIDTDLVSVFRPDRHDVGEKSLSHRFNNVTISDQGANEYAELVDIIFQQDEVSKNICRKLYRYFLNYEIDDDIENKIIIPMAQILRDNDYNIEPALKTLLLSEHFFGEEVIGCMIKNPVDFILSATKGLNLVMSGNIPADYFFALVFYVFEAELDMQVYFHPDVAGWKAYYQAPQFYRNWINTYYLPKRNQTSTSITAGGPVPFNGNIAQIPQLINVIEYVSTIPNATDPNELIYGIAENMFTYPISEVQKDYLKEIIIPGLPDFEWTVEYGDYLSDPFNEEKRTAINNKLLALFVAMLEMPEFQLM